MEDQSIVARVRPAFSEMVVIALMFLIPVFLIPVLGFPFQFSKVGLALFGVALLLLFFAIKTLRSGTFTIAWTPLGWGLLALPVAYGISAVFSADPLLSLWGYQLDADTVGFILLNVALSLVVFFTTWNGRTIFSALFALICAGWIVFILQLVNLFFGPLTFLGFNSAAANVIGKWNDLGLFSGLIGSLSLLALTSLSLSSLHKALLWVTLAVSLAFLAIINFFLAWALIGIVALTVLVYWLTHRFMLGDRQVDGIASLVVVVVTLFFLLAGSGLSTTLQNTLGIQALEVRPSLQSTLSVGEAVYRESPFFGSGPNTFSADWLRARPSDIVATPFWNVSFIAGFGSIFTAFITGGIVVGLAWIAFTLLLLYMCVRALLLVPADGGRSYFLILTTALSSLYLFAAHLFYVPGASLTLLTFLCFGLFMASLRGTGLAREISVSFAERPRLGFVSSLAIVFVLTATLVSLYGVGQLYASSVIHERLTQQPLGGLEESASSVSSAIALSPQDRYYRTLAVVEIARLREIVSSGKNDADTQEQFRATFTRAVEAATGAVNAYRGGVENWLVLGGVYQEVVPLGIEGSYENAVSAYEQARLLNPGTPEIDLHIAEMEVARNNMPAARTAAEASLKKKTDYTPAILLLAQISLNEGKLDEAISAVEAAVFLDPTNELLLYQLGLLYLQNKNYSNAALAFEEAIKRNPTYANALFFLGESYVFLGRKDDALAVFADLSAKNPENATLTEILSALQKGTNPFTEDGAALPPETTPVP